MATPAPPPFELNVAVVPVAPTTNATATTLIRLPAIPATITESVCDAATFANADEFRDI
jgi:hypothetical protein